MTSRSYLQQPQDYSLRVAIRNVARSLIWLDKKHVQAVDIIQASSSKYLHEYLLIRGCASTIVHHMTLPFIKSEVEGNSRRMMYGAENRRSPDMPAISFLRFILHLVVQDKGFKQLLV